ncbi:MAG: restriction endonuclease subunit S, partial [Bacilli bacterium]|nr:restriction endonuclease subunit S [Bacilli bacterium]
FFVSQMGQSSIKSRIKGAAQPCLFLNDLKDIEIDLPFLSNQQHIVNTIGTIDDLIEKYQEIINKINNIIRLKYANLEPSDIKLSSIAEIKYGVGLEAAKLNDRYKYPVYGSNGIIGTLPSYEFDKPKICISCRGASSGNVILTKPYATISSNSLYLNLKDENITLPLYSFLNRTGLNSFATGSAQPQITIDNLQHVNVPVITQNKNDNYIMTLYFTTLKKIESAKKCKELLLSKYF